MSRKFNLLDTLKNRNQPQPVLQEEKPYQNPVRPIHLVHLEENPNNFYNVEDVHELKASIKEYGVKQPLIVRPIEDDKYRIIAGHRRYRACQELVQEGCDYLEFIPCLVEDHIDDWTEEILLIYTNSTSRTLSDWEKIEQMKRLKKLLSAAKKENKIPGRVREQLAEVLEVCPATVGRMEQVDKNLKQEFKEELKKRNYQYEYRRGNKQNECGAAGGRV